tara:strand:- start:81 stop:947 length:867 start_codon:yes stop_codon:yes gene_type:complete
MAFTSPFFQGTQAQGIIDNYVNAGGYNQSFPSPSTNPYLVNSSAYVPPSSQPQPDPDIPNCEEAYPGEGRVYDPVMSACVLPEVSTQPEGNDREVEEEPYQGVGSINSPTQNAFGNLGLGSMYGGQEISKSGFGFDNFNQGLQSILGMTPLGLPLRMGRSQDINTLINSGVIEKGSDGKLTFAKGGNLNLVKANQEFEQNLARQQGLNLDAVSANPYIDQLGKEQFMVQSRGDKADNMSNNVYKDNNANVNINPFKSDYGAKEIVSYKPKNTYTSKYNQSKQGNPFER